MRFHHYLFHSNRGPILVLIFCLMVGAIVLGVLGRRWDRRTGSRNEGPDAEG